MGTVTIGCPTNYASTITRQPGLMTGQGLFPSNIGSLGDIVSLQWRRVRSANATANIFIRGCGANDRILVQRDSDGKPGLLDPWAHELVIHRDSRIAFMGPILDIIWHAESSMWEIQAGDMMTWTNVREIAPAYTSPNADAATILENLLRTYFFLNNDDPDFYRHIILAGTAAAAFTVVYKTATFSVAASAFGLV